MSFSSKVLCSLLVILIGCLGSVLLVFSQGAALKQDLDHYPGASTTVHLAGIPEERSDRILAVLSAFAETDGRSIVRIDDQLSNVDGGLTGVRIGLVADPVNLSSALPLHFLGTTLFGAGELRDLLTGDRARSIGLDANEADVIHKIPELAFAPRIAAVQLSRLVETSGTINGAYRIAGANEAQIDDLLASLEPLTNQSAQTMQTELRGKQTDAGLAAFILLGFLLAASLLLLFLLVFEAIRSSRALGVHLLLGRSTSGFVLSLFRPVLFSCGFAAVASSALVLVLMPGYALSPALAFTAVSSAAAGTAVTLMCIAVAAAGPLSIKPVDAILGRYSKKILLVAISGFYLFSVAGFSVAFFALDGPMKEVGALTDVGRSWADIEDQQILYREAPGNDQASFTGQSSKHARDIYEWYRSISDEPGVSLVNTEHYDRRVLDQWHGIYSSVPEKPFWYMAASPSYLASQGFTLADDLVHRASRGERTYLIPGSWTARTKQAMHEWLTEDSRIDYEASIETSYLKSPAVSFVEYSPRTPLFMWNVDPTLAQRVVDPVILILTPENMIPFESESLAAVGLENSYVKLTAAAAQNFTSPSYLDRFSLADNKPEFLPVSSFIAGLKKTIHDFLALFATVAVFLCVFCLILLVTLMKLFSTTYRESLAVKRMLGHSLSRLFASTIIVVGAAGALAVGSAILAQSTSALLANIVMLTIQVLMIALLGRRYSRLQISSTLKE